MTTPGWVELPVQGRSFPPSPTTAFMPHIETRLLPPWALVALILATGAAVIWLYRRERAVSHRRRRSLLLLRLASALFLVTLLADPSFTAHRAVWRKPSVLLAVDVSKSFSLQDSLRARAQIDAEALALSLSPEEARRSSRMDLARRAIDAGLLADLGERLDVIPCVFAERLEALSGPTALGTGDGTPRESAGGTAGGPHAAAEPPTWPPASRPGTDLARALDDALALARARGCVGIVLLSDGNDHGAGDRRAAAAALGSLGVRIVSIAVGALERPPDISVDSLEAPRSALSGDVLRAVVGVRSQGFPAQEAEVVARLGAGQAGTPEGPGTSQGTRPEVVARVPLSLPGDGSVTRIELELPAGEPGRKRLSVAVAPRAGEASATNNERGAWMEVFDRKVRVLLVDGGPRWEERYLRASWLRDPSVTLARFLVSPPPRRSLPADFPRERRALLEHDVIVLGDLEPDVFAREELETLADHVLQEGGTLVLLAGPRALPYAWRETPLEPLFPVELLRPMPPASLGADLARAGLPLTLLEAGEDADIARLLPDRARNFELWELLPAIQWFCPHAGPRPGAEALVAVKPAALLAAPGCAALSPELADAGASGDAASSARALERARQMGAVLVARAVGAGNVLFVGFDDTWRWRYRLGDELPDRFWGQVVRWAVSRRLSAGDDRVRLGTDRILYEDADSAVIEAELRDTSGEPLRGAHADALVERKADGARVRVRLEEVPGGRGRYRGTLSAAERPPHAPARGGGGAPAGGAEAQGAAGAEAVEGAQAPERIVGEDIFSAWVEVAELPGHDSSPGRAAVTFAVLPPPDQEAGDIGVDTAALEELATLSGGAFLPLSRAREAASLLEARPRRELETTRWSPWDHPIHVGVILIGLLALEWILRKTWFLH